MICVCVCVCISLYQSIKSIKKTRKKDSKLGGWSSVSNIAEELRANTCEKATEFCKQNKKYHWQEQ